MTEMAEVAKNAKWPKRPIRQQWPKCPEMAKRIKFAKSFEKTKMCQLTGMAKTTKRDLMAEKAEIAILNKMT